MQYGSTGKGCIASYLAWKYRPDVLSTTNMANAGHTAVNVDGAKFIGKIFPSPAAIHKWYPDYSPAIFIGPTAAFTLETFFKELNELDAKSGGKIYIHPRAGVITDQHRQAEDDIATGTKHLASTMQGCGTFLADKIMRRPNLKLARDYPELSEYIIHNSEDNSMPAMLNSLMNVQSTILHEGSQGFSLDISHGQGYPYCTSRSTTALQNITDMGIPITKVGRIYGVMRPYPIRVGNVVENGNTVGTSGGCYGDQQELTWAEVAKECGAPYDLTSAELTTVTKRLRRVYSYSKTQMREATMINGVTDIALNFANYIDWSCYGTNDYDKLSSKIKDFIKKVEDDTGVPVTLVGTGPQIDHVCSL